MIHFINSIKWTQSYDNNLFPASLAGSICSDPTRSANKSEYVAAESMAGIPCLEPSLQQRVKVDVLISETVPSNILVASTRARFKSLFQSTSPRRHRSARRDVPSHPIPLPPPTMNRSFSLSIEVWIIVEVGFYRGLPFLKIAPPSVSKICGLPLVLFGCGSFLCCFCQLILVKAREGASSAVLGISGSRSKGCSNPGYVVRCRSGCSSENCYHSWGWNK